MKDHKNHMKTTETKTTKQELLAKYNIADEEFDKKAFILLVGRNYKEAEEFYQAGANTNIPVILKNYQIPALWSMILNDDSELCIQMLFDHFSELNSIINNAQSVILTLTEELDKYNRGLRIQTPLEDEEFTNLFSEIGQDALDLSVEGQIKVANDLDSEMLSQHLQDLNIILEKSFAILDSEAEELNEFVDELSISKLKDYVENLNSISEEVGKILDSLTKYLNDFAIELNIEKFKEHVENISNISESGNKALYFLTEYLNNTIDELAINMLVKYGANLNYISEKGDSILHVLTEDPKKIEIVCNIAKNLQYPLEINILNKDNLITPILKASYEGNLESIIALKKCGADIEKLSVYGSNALHLAAMNNVHFTVIKYLATLTNQENDLLLDANTLNYFGQNALHLIFNDHEKKTDPISMEETTSFLINNLKIDYKAIDFMGNNILHFAIKNGHTKSLESILEFCAEDGSCDQFVNQKNYQCITPLMIAAKNDDLESAKLLVKYKADPSLLASNNVPALHFAVISGNYDLVKLLIDTTNPSKSLYQTIIDYAQSLFAYPQQTITTYEKFSRLSPSDFAYAQYCITKNPEYSKIHQLLIDRKIESARVNDNCDSIYSKEYEPDIFSNICENKGVLSWAFGSVVGYLLEAFYKSATQNDMGEFTKLLSSQITASIFVGITDPFLECKKQDWNIKYTDMISYKEMLQINEIYGYNIYSAIGKCREGDRELSTYFPEIIIDDVKRTMCEVTPYRIDKYTEEYTGPLSFIYGSAVAFIMWNILNSQFYKLASAVLGVAGIGFGVYRYNYPYQPEPIYSNAKITNKNPEHKLAPLDLKESFDDAIGNCEVYLTMYKNYLQNTNKGSKKNLGTIFQLSSKALFVCNESSQILHQKCDEIYGKELLDMLRVDLTQECAVNYKVPKQYKHIPEFCLDKQYYTNQHQWNNFKFEFSNDAKLSGENIGSAQEL